MNADTQNIIFTASGIAILLAVAVIGILLLFWFVRQLQKGKGPMGAVFLQAREAVQIGRESLTAQKETNELLKQIIARLDKNSD
jgi:hypothetical protein